MKVLYQKTLFGIEKMPYKRPNRSYTSVANRLFRPMWNFKNRIKGNAFKLINKIIFDKCNGVQKLFHYISDFEMLLFNNANDILFAPLINNFLLEGKKLIKL